MSLDLTHINTQIAHSNRLQLFLDYDGTLADFAPTPDHIEPDPEIATLLTKLSTHPKIQVAIISGRQLSHIQKLIPVSGLLLAGTYGIELQMPEGDRIDRVSYDTVRPALDKVKPGWEGLIEDRKGFYLEDKGWALALHARFAADEEAKIALKDARQIADDFIPYDSFRVLGGHKFLEIGPKRANKGQTVEYLLQTLVLPDAQLLYLGDDDKDEEAFEVIKAHNGFAVLVSSEPRHTVADGRLDSPAKARDWLSGLPIILDQ